MIRILAFSVFLLWGCSPQADEGICLAAYRTFDGQIELAERAQANGDIATARYHAQAAQMNLDLLLEKGCCRFEDACPAFVQF